GIEKPEAEPEDARLVAEPGAVRHPDACAGGGLIEADDRGVIEHRRLEPHAADRTGVRPDPFDVAAVHRHPIGGHAKTFGEARTPVAEDAIALLQDVKRQRFVDRRAGDRGIEFAEHQLLAHRRVARDRPPDAKAWCPVTLRERRDRDDLRAQPERGAGGSTTALGCSAASPLAATTAPTTPHPPLP